MKKKLGENVAMIVTMISTLLILICQFLDIGCEFFKFKVGVVTLSVAFCCVFVYSVTLYWQAVFSFRVFMSMFSGIRKWTVTFFLISIVLLAMIVNSYEESMSAVEAREFDHLNRVEFYLMNSSQMSEMVAFQVKKLAYSICFTLYTFGQMLIFKQKKS